MGIGEVKGFEFTKVAETDMGYVYCVRTSDKSNHYEVFKKRKTPICIDFENKIYSETEFKEVYPNSKQFGITAWSVKNYETALERLNVLGQQITENGFAMPCLKMTKIYTNKKLY